MRTRLVRIHKRPFSASLALRGRFRHSVSRPLGRREAQEGGRTARRLSSRSKCSSTGWAGELLDPANMTVSGWLESRKEDEIVSHDRRPDIGFEVAEPTPD